MKLSELEAAEATFHELDSLVSPEVERASLEHVHRQVQISLVLLTALLGPPEHNLSPVQSALFERYKGEPDDHMEIEVGKPKRLNLYHNNIIRQTLKLNHSAGHFRSIYRRCFSL